jgi:hypothetical protein
VKKEVDLQKAYQEQYDTAMAACKAMMAVAAPTSIVMVLDHYERDNLLALLDLVYCGQGGGGCPLGFLDTGDWTGQIYWKLDQCGFDPSIHKPNASPIEQAKRFRDEIKARISLGDF